MINWQVVQGRLGVKVDGTAGRETWGKVLGRAVGRDVDANIERMAQSFAKYATAFDITESCRAADLIANMAVETGRFTKFEENLNYSAQGLANTWPGRYAVDPHAKIKVPTQKAYGLNRRPEAIANDTYALRMGNLDAAHDTNGNPDGWEYRGRGAFMLTGRANYIATGAKIGLDLENHPELASDPGVSVLIALQYVKDRSLNTLSDHGDISGYRHGINGGAIGLEEVKPVRKILMELLA